MDRRLVSLLTLAVLAAGCKDEPMTESEIYHFKELYDRPVEIDKSQVESFELKINGKNGIMGHPRVPAGTPIEFTGRLQLKEGVLTDWISGKLRVGYRKVEDGNADWSVDESTFQEFSLERLELNEDEPWKVDYTRKKNRLEPGLYQLRYYLLLEKFRPDHDFNEITGIYYLNYGELEILTAKEEDQAK